MNVCSIIHSRSADVRAVSVRGLGPRGAMEVRRRLAAPAPPGAGRRGLRRAWHLVRAPLIAGLIAANVLLEAALVTLWAVPFDPTSLVPRGGPLVIVDRRGQVLATVANPGGQPDRDHWVPLGDLPAVAVSAVIEAEDRGFWNHHGLDARGIARAAWLDLRSGHAAYGGSTLTMQLARMLASPGQRRTWSNKLREAMLALRLERALDKRTILEQWLNRASFGHGAYGIEAAAELYFGKRATSLSTAEAVLLVVIPRAPGVYDPIRHLDVVRRRSDDVLALLVRRGVLSPTDARAAMAEPLDVSLHPAPVRAPHVVAWVLEQLPEEVKSNGGVVHTTFDAELAGLQPVEITQVDRDDGTTWRPGGATSWR